MSYYIWPPLLAGLRAVGTSTNPARDFRERDRDKRGHIVIRGSKTEAGTDRLIPLDDEPEAALRNYLRFE